MLKKVRFVIVVSILLFSLCSFNMGSVSPTTKQYEISFDEEVDISCYKVPQILDNSLFYYLDEIIKGKVTNSGEYRLMRMNLSSYSERVEETFFVEETIELIDNGAVFVPPTSEGFWGLYWDIRSKTRKDTLVLNIVEGHHNKYIVYVKKTGSYKQVHYYDVVKGQGGIVTSNNANHEDPKIYNQKVVYCQFNRDWDLYTDDLTGGSGQIISNLEGDEGDPKFNGTDVVYKLTDKGNSELYYVNVFDKDPVKLCDSVGNYTIQDGRILYYDNTKGTWYVYFIDSLQNIGIGTNWYDTDCIAVSLTRVFIDGHFYKISEKMATTTPPPTTTPAPTTPAPTTTPPPTTTAPTTTAAPTTTPPPTTTPAPTLAVGSIVLEEFLVSSVKGNQYRPTVYGDYVVWADYRNGEWDIYGKDIGIGEEFPICVVVGELGYPPEIYGDIVVWYDKRSGDWDIYGYNLKEKKEFLICAHDGAQSNPDIYGDIVVWHDRRSGGDWDIYAKDLGTGKEFVICNAPNSQTDPQIWGDVVVWRDYRNDNWDVYGYNLTTEKEFPICTNPNDQNDPDIYGDIVVWEDKRNDGRNIYAYDIEEEREFPICISPSIAFFPRIYGDIVTWSDNRSGDWDIYGYNIGTEDTFAICNSSGDQYRQGIGDGIVVWSDGRGSDFDIYAATLDMGTSSSGSSNMILYIGIGALVIVVLLLFVMKRGGGGSKRPSEEVKKSPPTIKEDKKPIEEPKEPIEKKPKLSRKEKELKNKIGKLEGQLIDGNISEDTYKDLKKKYESDLKDLKKEK